MVLNTENQSGIAPQGIPFWDISCDKNVLETSSTDPLFVLIFGLPKSQEGFNGLSAAMQWSRPVRIQQGIIRQCVFLQTSDPDPPLPVVVITLIENGLIKVIVTEDKVPRMLLTNQCTAPIQFGQCPSNSDKQNAKSTALSGRDLVVAENLEQYTTIPRLDCNSSAYYEPPELRQGFLTKKPQVIPKIRVQVLKQADINEKTGERNDEIRTRTISLPQGWSEAIDVTKEGRTAYILPGDYRLHVQVVKETSSLIHVVFSESCSVPERNDDLQPHDEVKV